MKQKHSANFIDLFCGCGGLTRGLLNSGLQPIAGFDLNPKAIHNFNLNFPGIGHVVDIHDLHLDEYVSDILVAGLPCQSFSTLGKMDPDDPRNDLWEPFIRLVEEVKPLAWAVENVARFLGTDQCRRLLEAGGDLGYSVIKQRVSAIEFGVPQKRTRSVLMAARGVEPRPLKGSKRPRSVRQAFEGLPERPNGQNLHLARQPQAHSIERYPFIPPGGDRRDLPEHLQNPCWRKLGRTGASNVFGRLNPDEPSDTVRTTYLKPETGRYIHPTAHRGLTVREGMRLQTFDDRFELDGAMHDCAVLVGNAVPPNLGAAIGGELLRAVVCVRAAQETA